jgi:hypothetical protein
VSPNRIQSKPILNKQSNQQIQNQTKKKKEPSELLQLFTMAKKGPTLQERRALEEKQRMALHQQ